MIPQWSIRDSLFSRIWRVDSIISNRYVKAFPGLSRSALFHETLINPIAPDELAFEKVRDMRRRIAGQVTPVKNILAEHVA